MKHTGQTAHTHSLGRGRGWTKAEGMLSVVGFCLGASEGSLKRKEKKKHGVKVGGAYHKRNGKTEIISLRSQRGAGKRSHAPCPHPPSLPRFSTRPRSDQNCRRDARGDDTSHAESEQAGRKFCAVREQRTDWRRQASRSVVVCVQYVTVSVRFRLGPQDCAVMLSFLNSACYVRPEG